jgi:hypothetical protein
MLDLDSEDVVHVRPLHPPGWLTEPAAVPAQDAAILLNTYKIDIRPVGPPRLSQDAEFKEADHPRGQPDNSGKFAKAPARARIEKKETKAPKMPSSAAAVKRERDAVKARKREAAFKREGSGVGAQSGETPANPGAPPPGPAMAPLTGSAAGSHPATIPSRLVTGVGYDPSVYLRSDVDGMKATPVTTREGEEVNLYKHNIGLLRNTWNYQNLRPGEVADDESDDHVARSFIDHVKANLKFLYKEAPKAIRDQGHWWYEGAHNISRDQAARYNLPLQSVAGVYASQSPQKLWDMNVYLGDRILDIYHTKQSHRWDDDMEETAGAIWHKDDPKRNADLQKQINAIRGKTLAQCTTPLQKAQWIRTYDEANSSMRFQAVSADGKRGEVWRHPPGTTKRAGETGIATWQSTSAVIDAIKCIESGGDREVISDAMGELHKVRCFYNNILDPASKNGDVTVDTHAVGAGLMRGLGASAIPVMHSLMTSPDSAEKTRKLGFVSAKGSSVSGSQGTYPIYADAYREAAEELGISPRTLQSVTWEAKRLLFGLRPGAGFIKEVEDTWQKYHEGKQSLAKTQQSVIDIAKQRNPNGGFF